MIELGEDPSAMRVHHLGDPRQFAHGGLAILRCVADIGCRWILDAWKLCLKGIHDAPGFINGKCRLRQVDEGIVAWISEGCDFLQICDQVELARCLSKGTDSLNMPMMADVNNSETLLEVLSYFKVNLGYKRTRGIQNLKGSTLGDSIVRRCTAMRTKHNETTNRDVGKVIGENHTA